MQNVHRSKCQPNCRRMSAVQCILSATSLRNNGKSFGHTRGSMQADIYVFVRRSNSIKILRIFDRPRIALIMNELTAIMSLIEAFRTEAPSRVEFL